MSSHHRHFVPAARHDLLLPFYDPLLRLLGARIARQALIEQADIRGGHQILDIGCGTGDLVIEIARQHPDADIIGLDPDPKALARATRKANRDGAVVRFEEGFADALPYPNASFDRVVSSFMFHHLDHEGKRTAMSEVWRVLKPGGSIHVLDFGGAQVRADGWLARRLHSTQSLNDNFDGGIQTLMSDAGLTGACEAESRRSLVGRMTYYAAVR